MKCWLLLTTCVASVIAQANDDQSCHGGYALELRPSEDDPKFVGRGEYQLEIRNLTSGPGIYRLSAWVMYSSDLEIPSGNRTVFHARWYGLSGDEIGSGTNLVFDEKLWPSGPGAYQYLQLDFDTGDEYPAWIEWYVGYPLLLEAGVVRMTGLQADGPDGRRYIRNGNFIWKSHIEHYNEEESYGVTELVEDCNLPPIDAYRFRLDGINTEHMSSYVHNIDWIEHHGEVNAMFEIRGSFKPNTFASLSYYWFEPVEDDYQIWPNRVQWLDNILVYFDSNGYITTPSPKNVIVTDDMLRDARHVSGIEFLSKYYALHWPYSWVYDFDKTHLSLPGLRYDHDSHRILVENSLPALLLKTNDTEPLPLDFTFGPGQPTVYHPFDW